MGRLQNKIFVVTGANSGIGCAAAESFAEQGAEVVLVCRNEARGRAAQQKIQQTSGSKSIHLKIADFSSLKSISALADRLLARYPRIDVLCNNAGGANAGRKLMEEGFELTFATNHLSGFLLTKKLLPSLLEHEGDPARYVFTSSLGHKNSLLDFNNLGLEKDYSTLKAYGRNKLMNLLIAREIHARYGDNKLIASSFHPGAVCTLIWSKGGILARLLGLAMYPFMWSIEKGADTLIWLASAGDVEVLRAEGNYFFDRRKPRIAEFATDEAAAELWRVSEKLPEPYFQA